MNLRHEPTTISHRMSLAARTRIGVYEIVAPIGSGGMGDVYRAHDTKLRRDVAIKVLPPFLANDPDSLSRFGREARLLAALNHPRIATIHGFEEADGVHGTARFLLPTVPVDRFAAPGPRGFNRARRSSPQRYDLARQAISTWRRSPQPYSAGRAATYSLLAARPPGKHILKAAILATKLSSYSSVDDAHHPVNPSA